MSFSRRRKTDLLSEKRAEDFSFVDDFAKSINTCLKDAERVLCKLMIIICNCTSGQSSSQTIEIVCCICKLYQNKFGPDKIITMYLGKIHTVDRFKLLNILSYLEIRLRDFR